MLKGQCWKYMYNVKDTQRVFTYFQDQFIYMFEEAIPEYMHQTTYKTRIPWL